MTTEYLDVLGKAGVRATFFVIGSRCGDHSTALAETARRGHDVAGHGWSHTPFTQLSTTALESELAKTSSLLPSTRGRARMVRPPFGRMTPRSLFGSYRAGYASAMWSFDPLDWQATTTNDVVRAVDPSKLRGGDIVLLHEERRNTLDALPEMIRRVQDAGFELVTLSDLVPL
jgi:peptidoglycan/xylan/chitin deacetylase (PgdA/CDA1 family)